MSAKDSSRVSIWYFIALAALTLLVSHSGVAYASDGSSDATEKDETVHVYVDASGAVSRTEVTAILKNGEGLETIEDYTDVSEIIDVESDIEFTKDGNDVIWKAKGDDVTYTGAIEREVPVELSVRYYLDGTEIDPEKIVGAEGNVSIRLDFTNHSVDERGICTPFTAVVGIIFEEDALKNIEVTNGKVVQDGGRSIVVGYALPGLKESLGEIQSSLDIPEYVEITGTAGAFEMKSALVMVTPNLLDDLDASDLDVSGLESTAYSLESGISQLVDASTKLTDGLARLSEATEPVEEGARQLSEGAGKLADGAGELSDGLGDLKEGASQALSGSWDLKQGADALVSGIYILVEGDGQTTGGLKAAQAGAVRISDGIEGLVSGLNDNSAGLPAISSGLESAASALEGVPAAGQGADATIAVALATIDAYVAKGDISAEAAASLKATLSAAQAQAYADQATAKAVAEGLATAKAGIDKASAQLSGPDVSNLISSSKVLSDGLASAVQGGQNALYGANQVAYGLGLLNNGLSATVDGLGSYGEEGTILGGAGQVASGAQEVSEASLALSTAIFAIADSIRAAAQGAQELTDGLGTYQNEGISQLSALIENDVVGTRNRVIEIADRGRAYDTFSGKADATSGSVKFIYEIEGFSLD